MEELSAKAPLFKKIDHAVFDRLDKFKQTPNYMQMQDMYNGLEEEQQKVLKGAIILILVLAPMAFLGLLWWQNSSLRADLDLRKQIVAKASEILGQKQGVSQVRLNILSGNPIDGESMMTSRLSNLLSAQGVELSKFQVRDFNSNPISSEVLRSEADFSFSNLSTDELMNVFMAMIQREKFRISEIEVRKNPETGLLQGNFHAVHLSVIATEEGEE